MTTGGWSSSEILQQEEACVLPTLNNEVALEIGKIAIEIAEERNLGVAIEIRLGEWTVFKAALPGSKSENDGWINRKANVVALTHHSTMYERVRAEELGIDWHSLNKVKDETHAIHGGGFPLRTKSEGLQGTLLISGLPQVDDHKLAIEILGLFLKRIT